MFISILAGGQAGGATASVVCQHRYGSLPKAFDVMDTSGNEDFSKTDFVSSVSGRVRYCSACEAARLFEVAVGISDSAKISWKDFGISESEWVQYCRNKQLSCHRFDVEVRKTFVHFGCCHPEKRNKSAPPKIVAQMTPNPPRRSLGRPSEPPSRHSAGPLPGVLVGESDPPSSASGVAAEPAGPRRPGSSSSMCPCVATPAGTDSASDQTQQPQAFNPSCAHWRPEAFIGEWYDMWSGSAVTVCCTDAYKTSLIASISRPLRGSIDLNLQPTQNGWRCGRYFLDPLRSTRKELHWVNSNGRVLVWIPRSTV